MQQLLADPALLKTAVEEIVRWITPSSYKRRTATRDIRYGEQLIREGDKVTFWEMSANRDEQVFEQPFEFDIERTPNRHLGFGAGVHFCLGSVLARLELKVVFEALLASPYTFQLAGQTLLAIKGRTSRLHVPYQDIHGWREIFHRGLPS